MPDTILGVEETTEDLRSFPLSGSFILVMETDSNRKSKHRYSDSNQCYKMRNYKVMSKVIPYRKKGLSE